MSEIDDNKRKYAHVVKEISALVKFAVKVKITGKFRFISKTRIVVILV